MSETVNGLLDYIHSAVSPYHGAKASADMLDAAGFERLEQAQPWNIKKGGRYYTVCFSTTVIAFTVGENFQPGDKLRICAAHIDWPCLHIKPSPELTGSGCCRLNIEPYGGMIFPSWLDRPLSVAGRLAVKDGSSTGARSLLVNFEEPILTIPNLAIHMNGKINSGYDYNANRDMIPIIRTVEDNWNKNGYLNGLLAKKAGVEASDILFYDLCVYNTEKGCIVGAEGDMLSAPRLDNLTSAYACLYGIINSGREDGINAAVLYDHEEIGSKTKQGAASTTLSMLLEKLSLSLGLDRSQHLDMLMNGTLLSCDVAHAVHPNRSDMADSTCRAFLNRGVVLKMNNNQRYPTDTMGTAGIASVCESAGIQYQLFMNRPDMAGGGTIGADASSQLGMCTIDCGVPILAMHSARELMSPRDEEAICALTAAMFR